MIKPKGWIDDIVVYPAIFGQKATLSSMNEIAKMPLRGTSLIRPPLGDTTFDEEKR